MVKVEAIKKNFSNLDIGLKVFFTIILCADENGSVRLRQTDISKYLKVSRQTVGKHIRSFVDCDMLKYKYSGEAMLNPSFYYSGSEERRQDILKLYNEFKSDMKAV